MTMPLIVAHRGALSGEKENTLESFELAIALGADMIEFDLRSTKDHVLVAHHDPDVGKYSLRELTLRELKKLKPEVPRLEEILDFTHERIALDIEVKESGFEGRLVELLKQHRCRENVVITSFEKKTLKRIKELNADQRTGLLINPSDILANYFQWSQKSSLWRKIIFSQADFIAPHYRFLHERLLQNAKDKNLPIFVWTVNSAKDIGKHVSSGWIDAIITDKSDAALSIRNAFVTESKEKAAS